MSIYKENKLFVNKYKSALMSVMGGYLNQKGESIRVLLNNKESLWMRIDLTMDKDIYLYESSTRRLYFCVKFKEKGRVVGPSCPDNLSDEDRAICLFADSLGRYSTPDKEKEEIKNHVLNVLGITKLTNGTLIKDVDNNEFFLYHVKNEPLKYLKNYPKVKDTLNSIKTLRDCPINIYRHPDVQRYIKDKDLIPISYIEDDELVYPSSPPRSRRATSFYRKIDMYAGNLLLIAKKSFTYTPFDLWVVCMPESSVIDEKETFNINFSS